MVQPGFSTTLSNFAAIGSMLASVKSVMLQLGDKVTGKVILVVLPSCYADSNALLVSLVHIGNDRFLELHFHSSRLPNKLTYMDRVFIITRIS